MADGVNGNGTAKLEALARSAILTVAARAMMTVGMGAVLTISGFAGKALWDLNATISAHTATLDAIDKHLDQVDKAYASAREDVTVIRSDVSRLQSNDQHQDALIADGSNEQTNYELYVDTVICKLSRIDCRHKP